MLKYNIRVDNSNINKHVMSWQEKYLSPDLSLVSGTTLQSNNIYGDTTIEAANVKLGGNKNTLDMETENVTRNGFVLVKGYKFPVNSGFTYDYTTLEESGERITYNYVFINGRYYYSYNDNTFTINNFPTVNIDGVPGEYDFTISYDGSGYLKLDKVFWIEDGMVGIDGNNYYYDGDFYNEETGELGGLAYYDGGEILKHEDITNCDGIEFHKFEPKDYVGITKFLLKKRDDDVRRVENIGFVKYFYYVMYKDVMCPIRMDFNNDSFEFICEVPKYALSATTYGEKYEEYETVDFPVMFESEIATKSGVFPATSENLKEDYEILDLDDLYKVTSFVIIDETRFFVINDILNTNDGNMIRVELIDNAKNIGVGTKVYFNNVVGDETYLNVHTNLEEYSFNQNDDRFVVYKGEKHKVVENLCDMVKIAGTYYEINYINGKEDGKDCLVNIAGENVPMLIKGERLQRYGVIVQDSSSAATIALYEIEQYDGVILDGIKYPVISGTGEDTEQVVILGNSDTLVFTVLDVKGSSMLICKPLFNDFDFTSRFDKYYSGILCQYVVNNQADINVSTKNTIFGEKEITKELAFQITQNPISSDDYYNLFDDLLLFCDTSYLNVSLPLVTSVGGNPLQDNLVERDFVPRKTEELINPIVDMEKDVYLPKFIPTHEYVGSATDFKPIDEIRINLHFRTRNEDNWKINEGYNLVDTKDKLDNWFVTDFYPYAGMLSDPNSANTLQETSDIMGLLYFTNDDIFYQKQKVGKSFVRLTFYDTPDPNTQSLLCNSCVFFDYRSMFKTYMDNSQKNINKFCVVGEEENNIVQKKISVKSELLSGSTITSSGTPVINEEHRISSRLSIKNKYETSTSSEGFYLYIFREYSEKLRPKPIYMKVEFNHAGIGRTIPFTIPMKWNAPDSNSIETPERALMLSATTTDLKEMKEGIPLSRVRTQLYIPLYAVYDFKNKEYAYVFDERYVDVDDENGVVNLNLFELKVKDESGESSESERNEITTQKQPTPVIDINKDQFEIMEPKCS
jgi:hypothetical protein